MKPTSKVAFRHDAEQREVRPIKDLKNRKKKIQIVIYYKVEKNSGRSQWSSSEGKQPGDVGARHLLQAAQISQYEFKVETWERIGFDK